MPKLMREMRHRAWENHFRLHQYDEVWTMTNPHLISKLLAKYHQETQKPTPNYKQTHCKLPKVRGSQLPHHLHRAATQNQTASHSTTRHHDAHLQMDCPRAQTALAQPVLLPRPLHHDDHISHPNKQAQAHQAYHPPTTSPLHPPNTKPTKNHPPHDPPSINLINHPPHRLPVPLPPDNHLPVAPRASPASTRPVVASLWKTSPATVVRRLLPPRPDTAEAVPTQMGAGEKSAVKRLLIRAKAQIYWRI